MFRTPSVSGALGRLDDPDSPAVRLVGGGIGIRLPRAVRPKASLWLRLYANPFTEDPRPPFFSPDDHERDGLFRDRVLFIVMNEVTLRRAQLGDSSRLWVWRNDPDVRAMSLNPHAIPWEEHQTWFAAKLADPRCLLFLVEDEQPIGQVRFELDEQGNEAEINLSLDRAHRAKGLSFRILEGALEAVCDAVPDLDLVHALIRPNNEASIRLFIRAGFSSAGSREVRGTHVLHYVWYRTITVVGSLRSTDD